MKSRKYVAFILTLIVLFTTIFVLMSCEENETNEQKSNRLKQEYVNFFLKESYPDITADDVQIVYYVGEYNNCDVVMMETRYQNFFDSIYEETISGVDFVFLNSNILYVCNNTKFYTLQEALDTRLISQNDLVDIGDKYSNMITNRLTERQFYSLQEAYETELLTQEDLLSIAYYHNGGIEGNEDVFPENYVPKSKDTEYLNDAIQNKIKQLYISTFLPKEKNATIEGITIQHYYGFYNGYVALLMSDDYSGTTCEIYYETVANVKFLINGREILIWG